MGNIFGQKAINTVTVGIERKGNVGGKGVRHAYLPSFRLFVQMLSNVTAVYESKYQKKAEAGQIQFLSVGSTSGQPVDVQALKAAFDGYGEKNSRKVEQFSSYSVEVGHGHLAMIFIIYAGDAPRMKKVTLDKLRRNVYIDYEAVLEDLRDTHKMVKGFNRYLDDYLSDAKFFQPTLDKFEDFIPQVSAILDWEVLRSIDAVGVCIPFLVLLALSDLHVDDEPLKDIYYIRSRTCRIHTQMQVIHQ